MNCRRCFALLGAIITMQWVSCPAFSQDREPHSLEPVTKIVLGAAGSQVMRFGDLDGDGMPEGIAIQNHKRQITALTAFRLDGSILWQIGEPNASNRGTSSDLPVQIFDIDGDGKD